MGKIISLSNQKGGSGKTTISANLAVLWSNSGYKVAVIDADNQKSLTYWYKARENYYGKEDTGIHYEQYDSSNLYEQTRGLKKKYDFVIIDSPPSITIESINITRSSNYIFIPVQPSPVDLLATLPFLNLVNKEKKKSTIILNRVLPRAKLTEAMKLRLKYSGADIARNKITSKIIFAETFNVGRGVIDISVNSAVSREIINLGNEIIRKLE